MGFKIVLDTSGSTYWSKEIKIGIRMTRKKCVLLTFFKKVKAYYAPQKVFVNFGDFKQYWDFINYGNHEKTDLQYFYVFEQLFLRTAIYYQNIKIIKEDCKRSPWKLSKSFWRRKREKKQEYGREQYNNLP